MTLQTTKEHLVQLLADQDNKVIALSGKWGTGKSHLWREVKAASKDEAVNGALYVSLFGLRDMNQIKLKVVQSSLPNSEKHSAAWEKVRIGFAGAKKVLNSLHQGFSAMDEIALLAVPSLLKNKVIVLDDIERKHDDLSIDEVLGFIDEFTQQHGARFTLILNSDQLYDRAVWDTLREKVVDQEIHLSTSSSEAFSIAVGLTPSPYANHIRAAVESCELSNIRIIRKVIKAVNRILGNRTDLADALLLRVVPSAVLLAAIHYKGIEDGPDFDFVLSQGTSFDWSVLLDKEKVEDDTSKRRSKWKLLLSELGIQSCDEFELLVIDYLKSGLFDPRSVAEIIDRYAAENEVMTARKEVREFFSRLTWDHRLSEEQLLDEAKALYPHAYLVDAYTITSLCDAVSNLPGGEAVAKDQLDRWIEAFKARHLDDFDDENSFGQKVHPAIQMELDAIRTNAQAKVTVFDVCQHIVKESGWGTRQELAMKGATVSDFETVIKTVDIDGLRLFMRQMLKMTTQPGGYREQFGHATDRFVEACRNIVQDPNTGRLGNLIKNLFVSSNLDQLLEHPSAGDVAK